MLNIKHIKYYQGFQLKNLDILNKYNIEINKFEGILISNTDKKTDSVYLFKEQNIFHKNNFFDCTNLKIKEHINIDNNELFLRTNVNKYKILEEIEIFELYVDINKDKKEIVFKEKERAIIEFIDNEMKTMKYKNKGLPIKSIYNGIKHLSFPDKEFISFIEGLYTLNTKNNININKKLSLNDLSNMYLLSKGLNINLKAWTEFQFLIPFVLIYNPQSINTFMDKHQFNKIDLMILDSFAFSKCFPVENNNIPLYTFLEYYKNLEQYKKELLQKNFITGKFDLTLFNESLFPSHKWAQENGQDKMLDYFIDMILDEEIIYQPIFYNKICSTSKDLYLEHKAVFEKLNYNHKQYSFYLKIDGARRLIKDYRYNNNLSNKKVEDLSIFSITEDFLFSLYLANKDSINDIDRILIKDIFNKDNSKYDLLPTCKNWKIKNIQLANIKILEIEKYILINAAETLLSINKHSNIEKDSNDFILKLYNIFIAYKNNEKTTFYNFSTQIIQYLFYNSFYNLKKMNHYFNSKLSIEQKVGLVNIEGSINLLYELTKKNNLQFHSLEELNKEVVNFKIKENFDIYKNYIITESDKQDILELLMLKNYDLINIINNYYNNINICADNNNLIIKIDNIEYLL